MWQKKTDVIPVVGGGLGTVKSGLVETSRKYQRYTVIETQKICMLGSARILRKVLIV